MSARTWRTTLAALRLRSKTPTTISHRRLLFTRIAAVSTFTAFICSQVYALYLPGPEPPKPYSPNDTFVIVFFALSAILNIYWLRQLFFEWDVAGNTLPLTFGWGEEPCYLAVDDELLTSPNLAEQFGRDARVFTANLSSAQVRCMPFSISGNIFMGMVSTSLVFLIFADLHLQLRGVTHGQMNTTQYHRYCLPPTSQQISMLFSCFFMSKTTITLLRPTI